MTTRSFQDGKRQGATEERQRLRDILGLPEADDAPELAANLALASDLDVNAVQSILQRSIQIRSDSPFPAARSRKQKAHTK